MVLPGPYPPWFAVYPGIVAAVEVIVALLVVETAGVIAGAVCAGEEVVAAGFAAGLAAGLGDAAGAGVVDGVGDGAGAVVDVVGVDVGYSCASNGEERA